MVLEKENMNRPEVIDNPILKKMVNGLVEMLGDRLCSIVLYGSSARGDFQKTTSDFNLLVVLEDLDPNSLECLSPVVNRWLRKGQPVPRLFSRSMIADSMDVFPIEFLDLQLSRIVLHGEDPFANLQVGTQHLRLQCERELREKMMRLREGYVEHHKNSRNLRRLLTDSYSTFIALFRGCLYLHGEVVPRRNEEVVAEFCTRAELNPLPFEEVSRLKHGDKLPVDMRDLFSRYYGELTRAVTRVDRFEVFAQEG